MVIENDSRRFIRNSIKIERELAALEKSCGLRGEDLLSDGEYNAKREELILQLSEINSISNTNGKGRDDLKDIGILRAAEQLPKALLVG